MVSACQEDPATCPVGPGGCSVLTPVVVALTPVNASLAVNDTLVFTVSIAGGSTTAPPALRECVSSNTAVATFTKSGVACIARALSPGVATVTAIATQGSQATSAVAVTATH